MHKSWAHKQFSAAKAARFRCGGPTKQSTAPLLTAVCERNGVDVDGEAVLQLAAHFRGHGRLDGAVVVRVLLLHALHKLHQQLLGVCKKQRLFVSLK